METASPAGTPDTCFSSFPFSFVVSVSSVVRNPDRIGRDNRIYRMGMGV